MNFALELFLTAVFMIVAIVIIGQAIWRLQRFIGEKR